MAGLFVGAPLRATGIARPPYHDTGDRAHRRPAAALRKPALHDLYEAGYAFIRPDRTVAWRGTVLGIWQR